MRSRFSFKSALVGGLFVALLLTAVPVGAAVGDAIRAGQSTSANKSTNLKGSAQFQNFKVTNTRAVGVAARFVVKPGNPPFHVSSGVTVPKLNADRVDGVHAAGLLKKKDYDVDKNLVVDDAEALGGVAAGNYVQKNGSWSCAGSAWEALESATTYGTINSLKYGSGQFRCSVTIPDGASMTAVNFAVHDSNATSDVSRCELWRTQMTGSVGLEEALAAAPNTSGSPGDTTLTAAVANGLVDNAAYSYFVQCTPGAADPSTGIYGATIAYLGTALAQATNPPEVGTSTK